MILNSENVRNLIMYCLFREGESTDNAIIVNGIMKNMGFHPERIKEQEDAIMELLLELPEAFMESKGGGWSFLNACMNKDGGQWGEHSSMEDLFLLGMAIEKVSYLMPKELWSALPGGMPYLIVHDTKGQSNESI